MSLNLTEKYIVPNYSKKEILEELDRILSSDQFSRSAVLSNFLKFIVEETLEGNTDSLKEYTIAVSALGKAADFDPQSNAIIRINAGRLRRLLNEYYTGSGIANTLRIEVIKGSYVPVFRPHEINTPTTEIKGAEKTTVITSLVTFSRSKLTLAILPFRNLLPDDEYQFFVDGFGEELTRIFSNFQDISVIAHHSSRKYAANQYDVRGIGANLGVHYIITGSVKRTSKNIRVNIGLTETMNGVQLWSQTYNHELSIDNLIDIQDEIIKNVCAILGGYYGFILQKSNLTYYKNPNDMASFDAVLWNYYFHMNYSEAAYLKTWHALESAILHNPNDSLVMAMLSELYLDAYSLGFPTVEDPVNEAYMLAKKAIKINPQCQHAHMLYGWSHVYLKKKEEAIVALEYSLSLNPSSVSSMGAIGFAMACAGEYKRARVLLTQSIDLNPHCPYWFYLGFFFVYYHAGQYEKALECANKIETPDSFLDPLSKTVVKVKLGLLSDAQVEVALLHENFPEILLNLKIYLSTFLLDAALIDDIILGAKKAGVIIS